MSATIRVSRGAEPGQSVVDVAPNGVDELGARVLPARPRSCRCAECFESRRLGLPAVPGPDRSSDELRTAGTGPDDGSIEGGHVVVVQVDLDSVHETIIHHPMCGAEAAVQGAARRRSAPLTAAW